MPQRSETPHVALRMKNVLIAQFTSVTVPDSFVAELSGYFSLIDRSQHGHASISTTPAVDESEFARLPDKRYSITEAASAPGECAICLQAVAPLASLKELPCGHCFHAPCLRRWLAQSRSCPCCRAALPPTADMVEPVRVVGHTADGGTLLQLVRGADRTGGAAGSDGAERWSNSGLPRRPISRTMQRPARARPASGNIVVRYYEQPPPPMLHGRPEGVPDDAHLLVARYPSGTARVWRFFTTVEQGRRARGSRLPSRELRGLRASEVQGRSFPIL